ncbi:MAG: type II toxin-antitoxin system RelE/ParE family toxin [Blastomonas sp.]|nr:type II toxin-antitoxin system RelE/ParE family toxin [Blastomonas sp.]
MVITTAARRQLAEITAYIARESGNRGPALGFRKRLLAKCAKLARLSATLGTPRSELAAELRSTPVGNYLLLFRYDESRVTVVAVLHASRDVAAHFDDD